MTTPTVQLALIDGLQPGAKLRENRCFALTPTGAEFRGEMTEEQWRAGMQILRLSQSAIHCWLADFITEGRQRFGDSHVEQTLEQLEFDQIDAARAQSISSLPREIRDPRLTTEHYWVLSKHSLTPEQLEHWKTQTIERRLTAAQLNQAISTGALPGGNGGKSGGITTIHGIRQSFDNWFARVAAEKPISKWEPDQLTELWQELESPVRVGLEVAKRLGINL